MPTRRQFVRGAGVAGAAAVFAPQTFAITARAA